jgi:RNA polymerase sigma factor (sigma-70 family)
MTEDEVTALYRNYGYVVFRRCVVYLGEPSAAQDAVQEVFVRALRAAADFREDSDPRTWLCRITDDFCVDVLRRRGANPVDTDSRRPEDFESAIKNAIGDDDLESLLMVRRLMEGLDADSLQLAVLYYVDELTQEELARALGLSRRIIDKRLQQLLMSARGQVREENAS